MQPWRDHRRVIDGLLPAYSPDFNPIGAALAKVKQALRRAGACSFDDLVAAIEAALKAVTLAIS